MNKCPFHETGHCDIWIDYQVLQYALEEAEELASSNWKEIQWQYNRIRQLESKLLESGITIPEEE